MVTSVIQRLILAAITTCVLAATRPTMHLQLNRSENPSAASQQQPSWMISGYDLSQNQELAAIEHHLESTDTNSQETARNLVLLEREISDMQGANRVWFWLLGGIVTAIGVAFWRSTSAQKVGK